MGKAGAGLSEEEIQRRLPVWVALTMLFLDTELTGHDYRFIAQAIHESAYSAEEVNRILLREVAPVFLWNLFAVAGEWQPWPEAFVEEKMRALVMRRHSASWLVVPLSKRMLREELVQLQPYLNTQVNDAL